jgi:putative ABC transport system permease protein
MLLLGAFAGLALILTLVGLYGLMAYSVARRTQEIGVRMALGANRSMVLSIFLNQAMKLVVFGVIFGSIGTIAITMLLRNMVYGLTPNHPLYFLIACGVMGVTGFIAVYIPARRAASIDPMQALRAE